MRRRFRLRRFGLRAQNRAARLSLGRKLQRTTPAASVKARGDKRERKSRQKAAGEERQSRRHGDSSHGDAGAL